MHILKLKLLIIKPNIKSAYKQFLEVFFFNLQNIKTTVKPVHVVTSIRQSPVLKGHIFLVMSWKI